MILRFKEGWLKGRNPYDHLQTAGPSGWSFGKGQPIQMIICKGRQQGAEGAFLNRLSFWNLLNAFWTGTADKLVSLEEVSLWKEVLSYHFKRVSLHWRGSEEVSCSHWGLRLRCYSQKNSRPSDDGLHCMGHWYLTQMEHPATTSRCQIASVPNVYL